MKKFKLFIKKNIKVLITLVIGIIISSTYVYATTIKFDSNKVKFNNTNSNLMKNSVAVTNVRDALDVLYEKTQGCGVFKPGDYVDMIPTTNTSTTINTLSGVSGSVTPSELSVWRVIRVNEDCTVEMVSEYVSGTNITLNGKDGYKNMVYGLNQFAKLYANTTYTLDPSTAPTGAFRNMGYDGQTLKITSDTYMTMTSNKLLEKTTALNGAESLGGGDQGFATDVKLLKDAGISLVAYKYYTTTPTTYFLASRFFESYSASYWYFSARILDYSGSISTDFFYYRYSTSYRSSGCSNALRPIVTLKSGITPTGGNGTSSSHYTLS